MEPTQKAARRSLSLSGYANARLLRASVNRRVYAAIRERDRRPVVIKIHERVDDGLATRISHEIRRLETHELGRVTALVREGAQLSVIREWCEGVDLAELAGARPLHLDLFFELAAGIVRELVSLHAAGIVHRALKPANIIIEPTSRELTLVDFGVSALLERELERVNDPAVVEGTLAYVSPEQTGRTHREVDPRSDLYSLGAILYELLTGRRPFAGATSLELIHAHLARRPEPPRTLRLDVPTALSDILMRLLEKDPELRYQSARGLGMDLERVATALREGRRLDGFMTGVGDVSSTLQLPHRLYGRAKERESLAREFRRAASGVPRFTLVTGRAGVGKTALVGELTEPVMSRHGYLARGKFDREPSDRPYAGFIAAFDDLAERLLTETDEQLGRWRHELDQSLGSISGAICELVPKLRAILDPVPPLAELGPVESHHRLELACTRLVAAFARVEHPLVIALDDMQWADAPSCSLLAAILAEPRAAVLVVGTLNPQELAADHPLRATLDQIDRAHMLWLDLGPLERDDAAAYIADALARPLDQVRSLAELVRRKTNDNPARIRQLLTHLVEAGLLRPTPEGWVWDREGIAQTGIPDDLLGLMTDKLERLDPSAAEVLTTAAVLGTRFTLATLELVVGPEQLEPALARLVDEGLLTTVGAGSCAFTHDRLREAAYARAPPRRRAALHSKVGRILLDQATDEARADGAYELVVHLDHGLGLVPLSGESSEAAAARAALALGELTDSELVELAKLNAVAAQRALAGAAAEAAVRCFFAGVRLLDAHQGEVPPELEQRLELGLCEALALAGQRDASERRFEALLRRPLDPTTLGRVVTKHVESSIRVNARRAAFDAGLAGLRLLGFELITNPTFGSTLGPLLARVDELGELGRCEDPSVAAAMSILEPLSATAYFIDRDLHLSLVTLHLQLILEHGRCVATPLALSQAALALSTMPEQHTLGSELIQIALTLAESEGPACRSHRIEPTRWLLASWSCPHASVDAPIGEAAARALEAGDLEFASYCTSMQASLSLSAGVHLPALEQRCEIALRRLEQWGARALTPSVAGYLEFSRVMQSGLEEEVRAADPLGIEHIGDEPELRASKAALILLQVQLLYLFGRYDAAWTQLRGSRGLLGREALGAWQLDQLLGMEGLLAAALYADSDPQHRALLLTTLEHDATLLRARAARGNPNLDATASLLEAELAAIHEPIGDALRSLGRARRKAAACGSPLLEAIALERIAEHARAADLVELALGPLRDARARYRDWGALTKVGALERAWPALAQAIHGEDAKPDPSGDSKHARALDMASILKTSQAIGEDIRLEEVVGRVLEIGLENAGADRGVLLLRDEGKTRVVAVCTAEHATRSFLREPIALEDAGDQVPIPILRFVERTHELTVIDDVSVDLRFASDPYVEREHVRSVLCLPILKQARLVGLLYLENKLSRQSFSGDRLQVLDLLTAQAASALENARLYEALRASEVRWRSLVEGLPDIVLLVDPDGRVEFINHLASNLHRSRSVGALLTDFVADEFTERTRRGLETVVEDARHCEFELRASFSDLGLRWYRLRIAPIVVDSRVERVIAVGTDITERHEARKAKAELEATLRQQQRLESIGTLASGVAHEINNPIQGIMNYAELITLVPGSDPSVLEFAAEIEHESKRVATIVRRLLAFSRHEGGHEVSPSEVREIIGGTLSLVQTLLRKDMISVEVEIPDGLPAVECQSQQIQQIIMNLVTNARDALQDRWPKSHEDKRITIRAASFEREGAPWVRISVEDRGGGMPEQIVGRIFDPFFTTKGRDRGTGLGLAVSHGIIHDHGGELRLDNRPGESACFHVELPVRAPKRA